MTNTIHRRVAAARDALGTHDELRRIEAIGERFPLSPDGMPINGADWLNWHDEQYQPALIAWKRAIEMLALELGDEFPGRHPIQFRPLCEQIVARADAAHAAAMSRHQDDEARSAALRAMRGDRNAMRAEQMRARGLADREIARRIGVGLATVRTWFHLQDELILSDDVDQPELEARAAGGAQ